MPNRLADATSPYLLQHKDNPVDWWPWGEDAFEAAVREDKPVLLSVGYAACHWCHVMAHESFEAPDVAALMNAHFVNVKVDREERPDVDAVYMEAVQAMTGHGGWPMTVFLTPTGEPFFAGTYFPPRPRPGMPSFPQVLAAVADTWGQRREEVVASGRDIASRLAAQATPPSGERPPDAADLEEAVRGLAAAYDPANKGFGGAPKFPPSMVLEFLLRHAARTGSATALGMAGETCEAMARGGMYDQLGGGFARYSVDAQWIVPHFEKMLYDNALLLRVYLHWWRQTESPLARRVALETAEFLLRELGTPEGGLASSLDADSEGEEGRFYVWTRAQLIDVLGPSDGAWAAYVLGVTDGGTFEHGTSVLQLRHGPDDPERFARARAALLSARERRARPGRDDKVVAAWNGLAIAALAEAGPLLDRPDLRAAAEAAADLVLRVHVPGPGRLLRVSRAGVAGPHPGVLEDYADVAEGLIALYGTTGNPRWLRVAGELLDAVLDRFADTRGSFFDTASDATDPRLSGMRRPQDPTDNATPSGGAAAAGALLSYAALTGSARHREAAEAALAHAAPILVRYLRFAGWWGAVAEARLAGPAEVAVVGSLDDARTCALHEAAMRSPAPGAVVALGDPEAGPVVVPLLEDRPLVGGAPTAYVCRGFACLRSVTDPAALTELLGTGA